MAISARVTGAAAGQLISATGPLENLERTTYNRDGTVATTVDALENIRSEVGLGTILF